MVINKKRKRTQIKSKIQTRHFDEFFIQNRLGGFEWGKYLEIQVVRRLVKFGVFYICLFRTTQTIRNPKKNRTFLVRCIFWWEWVHLDTQ